MGGCTRVARWCVWLDPVVGKRDTSALSYYEVLANPHPAKASPGTGQASNPGVGRRAGAMMLHVSDAPHPAPKTKPVMLRISPMAHFATAFLALSLLVLVPAWGYAGLVLLVIPVLGSVAIGRLRTVAGPETVTAYRLGSSTTLRWAEIDGLRFTRGGWARAHLSGGDDVLLPAVTFSTLPILAAASGGKVPNPYR